MKIKDYLHFFRWKNLLMLILMLLLIKLVLFQKYDINFSLDIFHFSLLGLSVVLIAIAGYIINDIQDIEADKINKPNKVFVSRKLSIKKANNLFIVINSIGLAIGFYLSIYVDKNSFFVLYILSSLLLYRYAIDLKKRFLIGNIIVALVVAFSIQLIILFDIVPATNNFNKVAQWQISKIILIISCFAFFLTLLREITKDLEDINGDQQINANTLAIVLGINKTKYILITISLIPLIALGYFAYIYYEKNIISSLYLIIFVSLPLLYFSFKTYKSKTKNDFHFLSNWLKFIMLTGILSIFFI